MTKKLSITISINNHSEIPTPILIQSLKDTLLDAHSEVDVALYKEDQDLMDLGSILQVVFSSSTIASISRSLALFTAQQNSVTLDIECANGSSVKTTNLRPADAVQIISILEDCINQKNV